MSLRCFDLGKIFGTSASLECDIAKGFSGIHFGKLQVVLQVVLFFGKSYLFWVNLFAVYIVIYNWVGGRLFSSKR